MTGLPTVRLYDERVLSGNRPVAFDGLVPAPRARNSFLEPETAVFDTGRNLAGSPTERECRRRNTRSTT
jgi:hypothetical protein